MTFIQEQFERLSNLMIDKGVIHEAFELLADLRQSERVAKQEVVAITDSIVVALAGFTDMEWYEGMGGRMTELMKIVELI